MAIHTGDIGTVFQIVLTRDGAAFDVSAASVKQIVLKDAAQVVRVKTASFTTDGTDGKVQYTTIAGDLMAVGPLAVQAKITVPSGSWTSDVVVVPVVQNL
jgi:hypothetical protein